MASISHFLLGRAYWLTAAVCLSFIALTIFGLLLKYEYFHAPKQQMKLVQAEEDLVIAQGIQRHSGSAPSGSGILAANSLSGLRRQLRELPDALLYLLHLQP
jgi:hypothetical protein